jgi:PKD repeat protein
MRLIYRILTLKVLIFISICQNSLAQSCEPFPIFFPDTICLGQSAQGINLGPTNNSYAWDLGGGDFNRQPTLSNVPLSGLAGSYSGISIVKEGEKYYGFLLLNTGNALVRLNFDTNLLSTPTITNLGNVGGALANGSSLKIHKSGENYFAFVINRTASTLVRYSFGNNISSIPTVSSFTTTNMGLSVSLDVIEEGSNFYVFVASFNQNKIGIFNFGTSLSSTPTFSPLALPAGSYLSINTFENCQGKFALLCDAPSLGPAKMVRLKFAGSFGQPGPTVTNLDISSISLRPGPFTITQDGGRILAIVSGWTTTGGFSLLNFGGNIESNPTVSNIQTNPTAVTSISQPTILSNGSSCVFYTTDAGVLGRLIFPNLNPSYSGSLTGLQPPAFSYSTPGKYFINYSSTAPNGTTTTWGDSIVVRSNTSTGVVAVDFVSDELCPARTSKFYPQVSPTGTYSYKWTFPGNITQTTAIGTRQFSTPGAYPVSLFARRSDGCGSGSIVRQVKVFSNPASNPTSNFTAPTQVCTKDSVLFTDQSTWPGNTIRRWKWDFGGGQVAFTKNAKAFFQTNQAGQTIQVSLTASDSSGCGTAVTKPVTPQAGADVDYSTSKLCKGEVTEFQNTTSPTTGVNFLWNFGEPSSGANNTSTSPANLVTHAFADSGFYQVSLRAITSNGCTSLVSKPIQIYPLPNANFSFPGVAFPGSPISFTNSSTAKYQTINSFAWNFGDPSSGASNTSTQPNPSHTFATFGSYDVNLKVTTNRGCIGERIKPVGIYTNCPLVTYSKNAPASGNFDTLYLNNQTTLVKETRIDYCAGDLELNPVLQSQQTGTSPITNGNQIIPIQDGNQWYGFIPCPAAPTNATSFFKATFGNSINNDISNFSSAIGNPQNLFTSPSFIRFFKEDSIWYGLAANANKLYRLRFGTSLDNNGPTVSEVILPTGTLVTPTGAQIIRDRDSLYVFIINNNNQITNNLIRLRFQNSIMDTPSVYVIPNPPVLQNSTGFFGITFYRECQNWSALLIGNSQLYRLGFGFSLNNSPTATSITGEVTAGIPSANAFNNLRGIGILNDMGKAYALINTNTGALFRVRFGNGINQPADGVSSLGTLGITGTVGAFNCVQSGSEYYLFALNTAGTVFKIKFPNKCSASLPYSVKTTTGTDTIKYSQPGKYYITLTAESPLGTVAQKLDSVVITERSLELSCLKTEINHPNEICFDYKLNPSIVQTNLTQVSWDFCAGDFRLPAQVAAAPYASAVSGGAGVQTVFQNGLYYTFVAGTSGMSRLNLGSSPDGTPGQPIAISMPSNSGFSSLQDIKFFNENGNWFALCVYQVGESIVRLNFGPNITNTTPGFTIINLPGFLAKSRGIDLFEEQKTKYAMIANQDNGTLVLLDFGDSYRNIPAPTPVVVPSAINLFKISMVRECNLWHAFVTDLAQDSIFRLTFNRGLYAPPVISGLSVLKGQGIKAIREGNAFYVFVSKVQTNFQNIYKLSFGSSFLNSPKLDSLGAFPFTTPATGIVGVAGFQIFQTQESQHFLFGIGAGNGNLYRIRFANTCSASKPIASGNTISNQSYTSDGKFFMTVSGYDPNGNMVYGFDSVIVKNLVEANFTVPGNRCKGEPVLFADGSTHGDFTTITNWSWDFGDPAVQNDSSELSNPSFTFTQAGIYPVRLRVREAGGCENEITKQITIADKPKPDFSWAGSGALCTNDSIVFTDLSQTTNDPIVDRNWEVRKDGVLLFTSTRQNPKFLFTQTGNYQVSLKVKGQSQCDSSTTKVVEIGSLGAQVNYTNESACLNEPAFFASQITGVTVDSLVWFVDNARITNLPSFTYTFNTTNNYTVRLVAYNGGCANSISKVINVNIKPAFSIQVQAPLSCQGLPINFSANLSTSEGVKFLWNFGDNTTDTARNSTKTFAQPGQYQVKLRVYTENGCARVDSVSFNAKPAPIALFSFDKACKDEPINFTNQSSANGIPGGITSYLWDFGNGLTSDQFNPGPVFYVEPPGNKIVKLTVRTAEECPNTYTRIISIGPKIAANFRLETGCIGTPFRFYDNTLSGVDTITSWNWNIGGLNYTSRNPVVEFDLQGTYGVRLRVVSKSGCVDEINRTNEFTVLDSARADFRILDNTFTEPPFFVRVEQLPEFNPSYEYLWDYGDGSTSNLPVPSPHNYATEGTYIITLTAWRAGTICSTQVKRVVNVVVNPQQGIAVRKLFSAKANGQLAVGMEIENESNVAIRSLILTAKVGNLATLREQWNGILLPGASLSYNFRSTILTELSQKIEYLCGQAQLTDAQKEITPENNNLCVSNSEEANLVSVYPNPAGSEVSIELNLPTNEPIEIKVVNALGKEAITYTDSNPGLGLYTKNFSLYDLGSGVYTVWFRSGKTIKANRLVVLRDQ